MNQKKGSRILVGGLGDTYRIESGHWGVIVIREATNVSTKGKGGVSDEVHIEGERDKLYFTQRLLIRHR